jgi:hypothetical protein
MARRRINPPIEGLEEVTRVNFWTFVEFLQENGLTRRRLAASIGDITEDFEIWAHDLTDLGVAFYRKAESKWLNSIGWRSVEENLEKARDRKRFERTLASLLKNTHASVGTKTSAGVGNVALPESIARKKPIRRQTSGKRSKGEPVKYDDASWHYGGRFPQGLPKTAGATHTGMFVAWALLAGLADETFAEEIAEDLERLRKRDTTPGAFFFSVMDGKLTSRELSEEGNQFARAYYDFDAGDFLKDYERTVCDKSHATIYHPTDSWENFDKLKPIFDSRLAAWKARLS